MELKMNQYQLPEKVGFNYEELKNELQAKVSQYETLIYSDEQIKEAKTDKANLNKLKKALNDERIRLQKEYMIPFNEFKAKIDELISIIDKPVGLIDKQVKEYEEQKKTEKLEKIKEYWQEKEKPFAIEFERIMDVKWLNSSVAMKNIHLTIDTMIDRINLDLDTLSNLPEFSFEAKDVYKTTLDLGKSINEAHRLAEMAKRKAEEERLAAERKAEAERQKAEAEAKKQEETITVPINVNVKMPDGQEVPFDRVNVEVPARQWISFKALLNVEEAGKLREFFEANDIMFEAI